ncbi:hypothetical protein BVRB_2g035170 isoform C [Beta vulgaris subsp. vulgaris]|nr:hypothetical protein BVRB_2g035170 isoform C [Beta vulgaris subsp. vulgaris]
MITLTGLMFLTTSALLGYLYSPRLDLPPPRWVHFMHGLLLFLYQVCFHFSLMREITYFLSVNFLLMLFCTSYSRVRRYWVYSLLSLISLLLTPSPR